ncbi:Retrovirus-related Pol polyprotein from transposon TNT 1-94 [Dictyocoela muelleri]|nr:Retrovirus-related Pol polyprotein from transposon TNT 1-94 [Dictyocoela muelleri]
MEINLDCLFCQQYKNHKINHDITETIETPTETFNTISSDIYGPFYTYDNDGDKIPNKNYILTITDLCSRYIKVFDLEKIKSDKVVDCFQKWFDIYKIPKKIITDNGKQYTSQVFKKFIKKNNNIFHTTTSPYNPQSNGMSERINQTITRVLNCNRKCEISDIIDKINFTMTNSYNRMIGFSPIEIALNYSELDPIKRITEIDINKLVCESNSNKLKSIKNLNKNKKNIYLKSVI